MCSFDQQVQLRAKMLKDSASVQLLASLINKPNPLAETQSPRLEQYLKTYALSMWLVLNMRKLPRTPLETSPILTQLSSDVFKLPEESELKRALSDFFSWMDDMSLLRMPLSEMWMNTK